jgi:hypothetical protein
MPLHLRRLTLIAVRIIVCHMVDCFYWPWVPATHILNVLSFTPISHASSCRGCHDSDNFPSTGTKRTLVQSLLICSVCCWHISDKHVCTESSIRNSLVFKVEYLIYFEACHNNLCCDTFNNSFCPCLLRMFTRMRYSNSEGSHIVPRTSTALATCARASTAGKMWKL